MPRGPALVTPTLANTARSFPFAARRATFEYVEAFHDRQRRHSGLDPLTPAQAHEQMATAA